jgi:hypothetical protein
VRRFVAVLALAMFAACGGGGGWSKADERRFVNGDWDSRSEARCALRVAESHFGSFDAYTNAIGSLPKRNEDLNAYVRESDAKCGTGQRNP